MSKKIITVEEAKTIITELKNIKKKIVVVGGCFDLLHVGHITFLEEAKKSGDVLIVLLEHDEQIRKTKGHGRPITTQDDRAKILASLVMIDYIIMLPTMHNDADYDNLLFLLKPAIIATTQGDPYRSHKERQAKSIGAQVIDVVLPIQNQSTTKILDIIKEL